MEVAVALVIIGLLLGVILKGAELVNSSKVRRMAAMSSSVHASYLGFVDRYRKVPGDWNASAASIAFGKPVNGGGNDNGRIDNPPGALLWVEVNALWEQLAKADFIRGRFAGNGAIEPTTSNSLAPVNIFQRVVIVGRTDEFEGATEAEIQVVLGRGLPVSVARELDVKLDDGAPHTGSVRATLDDAGITTFVGVNRWGGRETRCVDATPSWNVSAGSQDCNIVSLF